MSQNKYPLQINPGSSQTDSISNLPKESAIPAGLKKFFSLPQLVEGSLVETYIFCPVSSQAKPLKLSDSIFTFMAAEVKQPLNSS